MPDPIAAAFQSGWYVTLNHPEREDLSFVDVLLCQEAWRRLTVRSQRALVAISEKPGHEVHYSTRDCLRRRRLIDEHNTLTDAGRAVVRHRPIPRAPERLAGRPVIDVHLPPLPTEVPA